MPSRVVTYLLKARTVEPLLANGCVTRNSGVTFEEVRSVRSVPEPYNEDQLSSCVGTGSNASTIAFRVVEGNEKGNLVPGGRG
jgi:hypothetical protein